MESVDGVAIPDASLNYLTIEKAPGSLAVFRPQELLR